MRQIEQGQRSNRGEMLPELRSLVRIGQGVWPPSDTAGNKKKSPLQQAGLKKWRPQRDSNSCYHRERVMS